MAQHIGMSKVEANATLDKLLAELILLSVEYGELKVTWLHSEYYSGGAQSAAMAELFPRIATIRSDILSLYALVFREDAKHG